MGVLGVCAYLYTTMIMCSACTCIKQYVYYTTCVCVCMCVKALHTFLSLISCVLMGFDEVRCARTSSNPIKAHDIRERKVCRALSNKFGVVQAHRTSSNPLKTYIYKTVFACVYIIYYTCLHIM